MRASKCLIAVTRNAICSNVGDTRGSGAAARDNRSYCCRENFTAVALRDWGDSRKFCRLREREREWTTATIISDSRLSHLRLSQQPRKVFKETVIWKTREREKQELMEESKKYKERTNSKKEKGWWRRRKTKPKKTLKSISASPGKIRYRESREFTRTCART